jgi:hypothetical protein
VKRPPSDVPARSLAWDLGRGREGSGTARHNILANVSRLEKNKIKVQVIRHTKTESFAQDTSGSRRRNSGPPRSGEAQLYNQDGGGNSSTGRAPDCGSDGCGFDSRFPPQTFSPVPTRRPSLSHFLPGNILRVKYFAHSASEFLTSQTGRSALQWLLFFGGSFLRK